MGRPIGVGTTPDIPADVCAPAFVAQGERNVIRIVLYGVGATLADYDCWIVTPRQEYIQIDGLFVQVALGFTYVKIFEAEFTFSQPGQYTVVLHNTTGPTANDTWITEVTAADWVSRLDVPISDIKKQRTDIERVYNAVSRTAQNRRK